VWLYTTFISRRSRSWDKQAIETYKVKTKLTQYNHYYSINLKPKGLK
jgi:hypothetical protein